MVELVDTRETPASVVERNLLVEYFDALPEIAVRAGISPSPGYDEQGDFAPGFMLPELSPATERFLSAATARWVALPSYEGCPLTLLDLMRNPATQTTKTLASLLIVARAVAYVRESGERILLVSPTSGNKGVALRDAVWRAIDAGLVEPHELRVAVIAPAGCLEKLRAGELASAEELRKLNPFFLYTGAAPEEVKTVGREVVSRIDARARAQGVRIWSSLKLENYVVADALRALFEHDVAPLAAGPQKRVHAHAVSSAFGLLGYTAGLELLQAQCRIADEQRPGYLLVQHLGTPDMVLDLLFGSFDRANVPGYLANPQTGRFEQHRDRHFPVETLDVEEVLDGTFYTHRPVTAQIMSRLIARYGGDGVVVSLLECLERYPMIRQWLSDARPLPSDPRRLREWSLVMVMAGVLNAIDRGLIGDCEVVVHGSGSYTDDDLRFGDSGEATAFTRVSSVDDVAKRLRPFLTR